MCHERMFRQQRREQEDARRLWEVFNRETKGEPPERREDEVRLQDAERAAVEEREPAPVDR
jgi:hypothetical protein